MVLAKALDWVAFSRLISSLPAFGATERGGGGPVLRLRSGLEGRLRQDPPVIPRISPLPRVILDLCPLQCGLSSRCSRWVLLPADCCEFEPGWRSPRRPRSSKLRTVTTTSRSECPTHRQPAPCSAQVQSPDSGVASMHVGAINRGGTGYVLLDTCARRHVGSDAGGRFQWCHGRCRTSSSRDLWWSFHRPAWTVVASWERPKLVELEYLSLDHPAVVAAAKSLHRPL